MLATARMGCAVHCIGPEPYFHGVSLGTVAQSRPSFSLNDEASEATGLAQSSRSQSWAQSPVQLHRATLLLSGADSDTSELQRPSNAQGRDSFSLRTKEDWTKFSAAAAWALESHRSCSPTAPAFEQPQAE